MEISKMKVKLDKGAYAPVRAYKHDAGADLRTPESFLLRAHSRKVIDTGVHFDVPEGFYGAVKSKSGLMCNEGIVTDGVVDAGYSGSVRVCLFNHSGKHRAFAKGEKIAQIIFMPIITPEFEQVDEICGGDRGENGFGSTGR